MVNKQVYQFTCLPFGLATSLREFTKLLRPVVALLRQRGVKLHVYLDDWLIHANSPKQAQPHAQTTISVLQFLGWIINYEKSDLTPSQVWKKNSLGCSSTLDNSQWHPYQRCVSKSSPIQTSQPTICTDYWACWCSWHWYNGEDSVFVRSSGGPPEHGARGPGAGPTGSKFLSGCCQRWPVGHLQQSCKVFPSPPRRMTLFTDASSSGWGAQLGSRSTQGQWSASQRSWHINVLKMQAVINAVRDFLPHLRSRVVCLMCNNAVTVAYIKDEGGTRSYTLMQMTIRLLKWCDHKAITLVPVHLPGVHNIQADSLSRVSQTLNMEWMMAMERLRPMFAKWGEPQVDLSATFANRRLIKFVSPYPDLRAEWMNAMSVPWDNGRGLLYAFPPFKMVPQVLQKIAQSPSVRMILIAPLQ